MSFLRALRHRNYALLFSGQTLSRLGDFIFQIALAWWVLEKTGSALAMGAVLVFSQIPMLVFILLGGVVVDRFNRAWLLLLSDLGRGIVMALATWLVATGRLEMWMVYIGSLIFSFADAFFYPAYTALIPEITPHEDLPSANSLSSLGSQLARIVGPATGGLLVGFGGTGLAFGLNAASFFVSAATLLPIFSATFDARAEGTAERPGILDEVREGWAIVFAEPVLWVTILMAAFTNITLAGPFNVAMPFLVKDFLGGDERMLGFLLSIFPIGYLLAVLIIGNFKKLRYRGWFLYVTTILAGLALSVFGLRVPILVLAIAAILNGAALETFTQVWTNLLQGLVPIEKLGRVSSIDALGSFVLLPFGFALAGWSVEKIGPAMTFLLGGVLTMVAGFLALLHKQAREVD